MNNLEKIKLKMSTLFVINKWIAHQSEQFDRQLDGNVKNALLRLWPAYLIFVIFFTLAKFLENKIYTEKTRKLRQNTQ